MICAVCERGGCGPWQFYGCSHAAHTRCDREYEDKENCPRCAATMAPPPGATPPGVRHCGDCGLSLGTLIQSTFAGMGVPERCPACDRKARIKHMLALLPDHHDREWEGLNDFERNFLPSVRTYFEEHGTLTDKQLAVLERLYEAHR